MNREAKDTYTVTVTATDTSGEYDTITVTITVTDVDEPPAFTSGPEAVSYAETATGPVATYTAVDPEGGQVVWDKAGDDGKHFSVINGALTFNAQPDYEAKLDADGNNIYHVTVVALVKNSNATATPACDRDRHPQKRASAVPERGLWRSERDREHGCGPERGRAGVGLRPGEGCAPLHAQRQGCQVFRHPLIDRP